MQEHGPWYGLLTPADSHLFMPKAAHILLIEDDTSLAANLCDVLKEDGFKVTVCHRGDEGLRRAGQR